MNLPRFVLDTTISADYLATAPENGLVDLIVTSPPYPGLRDCRMSSAEWLVWFGRILDRMAVDLSENGVLALNVGAARVGGFIDAAFWSGLYGLLTPARGWFLVDVYAWDKLNPVPSGRQRGGRRYALAGWEAVLVASRSANYTYNDQTATYAKKTRQRAKNGALRGNGAYGGGHGRLGSGALQSNVLRASPSGGKSPRPRARGGSFPVELPTMLIQTFSNPGDLVLDPFAGVGRTLEAAILTGRLAIGSETDSAEAARGNTWLEQIRQLRRQSP